MMNWLTRFRLWRKVFLALLLIGVVILSIQAFVTLKANVAVSDLTPLSLDGIQRILILAPHSDDETLGSAGLIQAALRAGIEVRVVIATNGDGYLAATMQNFRKIYPRPRDFIRMGEMRQQESLAALSLLGVSPEKVSFLSYPDRGTRVLWNNNWSSKSPYRSPYSHDMKSPYPLTFNPNAVYAGEDLLADISTIIDDFRPDIIVYPHPEDVHPDHWSLNAFTRLAITLLEHADPTYTPTELTYLVHRPDFPDVRGLKPTDGLVPPPTLYAIYPDWLRWDLTPVDVARKGLAVLAYKSQLPQLHKLMESFVRANELFAPVTSTDLPTAEVGDPLDPSTWLGADARPLAPVELDPVDDVFTHKAVRSTDLTAVYAARTQAGDLWICAQLHGNAANDIRYSLRLKALSETGIRSYLARTKPKSGIYEAVRSGAHVCSQIQLDDLGNPWAIFLGAEVESPDGNAPYDQAGWQMVNIKQP